jgi:Flp pilus assembly protein TadG
MKATRQRGQVLVLFALALTVFIGAAALTVDFGFWLSEKRALQNAADAAAQAGISALLKRPITAAKRDAAADHAMLYLNDQLGLGLAPGEVHAAAA